jgi:S-adenosylmethionine decarboxylase
MVNLFSEETYDFIGTHYIASYYDCSSEKLNDKDYLNKMLEQAVEASGATILQSVDHKFSPQGVTILLLLAESHASIHTYPEQKACFVDLFTCGTNCDYSKFHDVVVKMLEAKHISKAILERQ